MTLLFGASMDVGVKLLLTTEKDLVENEFKDMLLEMVYEEPVQKVKIEDRRSRGLSWAELCVRGVKDGCQSLNLPQMVQSSLYQQMTSTWKIQDFLENNTDWKKTEKNRWSLGTKIIPLSHKRVKMSGCDPIHHLTSVYVDHLLYATCSGWE